ncbi:transcription elongation factor 1 [Anaeramoeba ignava]|uniref:Transcription elongation factor 1 homolog n=1 Tax=Anaeramoeba ignava TaxID=1746090 RepID=A0A9Q0LS68_ANAIG|nr:transcription elongation factor 1 [Anaeramoeba ignava]
MGRRKARKAPKKKKSYYSRPIEKIFDCPFCCHKSTVTVQIDRQRKIAELLCSVCEASFKMDIDNLSEPIDVYHKWIDECENANEREDENENENN